MSPGSDGSFWLAEQEYRRWRLDDWNPRADLARRGVLDPDVLPGYWFRDDALRAVRRHRRVRRPAPRRLLPPRRRRARRPELQAFASELVADDGGRVRGTPVTADGRLESVADLVRLLQQVVYTVSAEHGAVNNGQWDQFGYIPNTPGHCSCRRRPPST